MQTFLPVADLRRSCELLDDKRLGKQRVETFQILRALTWPRYAWKNHPAVRMWRGFLPALVAYGVASCEVWCERGFTDSVHDQLLAWTAGAAPDPDELTRRGLLPPWWGEPALHASHQSSLVRKDPDFYRPLFPEVPDDLPYHWPTDAFPRWPVRRAPTDRGVLSPPHALALLGYERARPGQLEALEALADGRDVLACFAPGAGATSTGTLASVALPGLALVVRPSPGPLPVALDPPERTAPLEPEDASSAPEDVADPQAEATRQDLQSPQSTAPPSTAPQSTAPQSTAPQSTAPQSTAPQSTAPQSTAPEDEAPRDEAQQDDAAPEGPDDDAAEVDEAAPDEGPTVVAARLPTEQDLAATAAEAAAPSSLACLPARALGDAELPERPLGVVVVEDADQMTAGDLEQVARLRGRTPGTPLLLLAGALDPTRAPALLSATGAQAVRVGGGFDRPDVRLELVVTRSERSRRTAARDLLVRSRPTLLLARDAAHAVAVAATLDGVTTAERRRPLRVSASTAGMRPRRAAEALRAFRERRLDALVVPADPAEQRQQGPRPQQQQPLGRAPVRQLLVLGGAGDPDSWRRLAGRAGAGAHAICTLLLTGVEATDPAWSGPVRARCRWESLLTQVGEPIEVPCGRCDLCDPAGADRWLSQA